MFLGEDLLSWLLLALGAAMAVGNGMALVRPPQQLEDGDQGVPVPLLGAPGRLLLLGSLLAGAFLRVHATRARS